MKSCCALRLAWRRLTGNAPVDRWTCSGCGQSYRWNAWHWDWEPISTAEDITDMMKHQHERHD